MTLIEHRIRSVTPDLVSRTDRLAELLAAIKRLGAKDPVSTAGKLEIPQKLSASASEVKTATKKAGL